MATKYVTLKDSNGDTLYPQAVATNLAPGSIDTTELADGAVTPVKMSSSQLSTSETVIGTWIDGKPLYRKVIDTGVLPNNTTKSVAHGISNLRRTIHVYGSAKNTSNNINFPLPFPSTQTSAQIYVYVDYTNIVIGTATDRTVFAESYIVVEYTKTTD